MAKSPRHCNRTAMACTEGCPIGTSCKFVAEPEAYKAWEAKRNEERKVIPRTR